MVGRPCCSTLRRAASNGAQLDDQVVGPSGLTLVVKNSLGSRVLGSEGRNQSSVLLAAFWGAVIAQVDVSALENDPGSARRLVEAVRWWTRCFRHGGAPFAEKW